MTLYRFILVIFGTLVVSCTTNTSIYFSLEEPEIIEKDNIFFTVEWREGIPLHYFGYKAHLVDVELPASKETRFLIKAETNNEVEYIKIDAFKVEIEELNVIFEEQNVDKQLSKWNNTEKYTVYKYISSVLIEINDILPPDIDSEKKLKVFKKVKYVKLTIELEYKINDGIKHTQIDWKFTPHIYKSNAIWDELMSV
jgi:hypothetical protein